jgi:hypothetical protein
VFLHVKRLSLYNSIAFQDEKFPIGIRVELQDLKAIAHMNGRRGTVCETPEENIGRPELAGRISVSQMRNMRSSLSFVTPCFRLSWMNLMIRVLLLCTCGPPI